MTGKLGDELIEAMGEALAHARGEKVPAWWPTASP